MSVRVLSADELRRALSLRDLSDPAEGPHAVQQLVADAVAAPVARHRDRLDRRTEVALPGATSEPIGDHDFWISALALPHARTLASRNERHFSWVSGLSFRVYWP